MDKELPLALLVIPGIIAGLGVGLILGVAIYSLLQRTTVTEVVRDEAGRIVQIVEYTPPLTGRWMYNVASANRSNEEFTEEEQNLGLDYS